MPSPTNWSLLVRNQAEAVTTEALLDELAPLAQGFVGRGRHVR